MCVLAFDHDNVGRGTDGTYGYAFSQPRRSLFSAGIRPIFMFTDHLAVQFEAVIDHVDEIRYTVKEGDSAYCTKLTVAPTIRKGRKFWDKPELRLFATYARWRGSARGLVGLPAYSEQTEGWNFGVLAETWCKTGWQSARRCHTVTCDRDRVAGSAAVAMSSGDDRQI